MDLYVQFGLLDDTDPRVVELSDVLRSLPIHDDEIRRHPRFRNPNGVSLKLANLLSLDPTARGTGMTSASKTDRHVFELYFEDPELLRKVAQAIRDQVRAIPIEEDPEEEDASADEGQLLFRLHRHRERNRSLRNKKIRQAKSRLGRLPCEACGMEFAEIYGPIGRDFIEVHHRLPLHESGPVTTRLADLALVCSNCHRMLHRDSKLSVDALANLLATR